MDKFILGNNPMREDADVYIIHMLQPTAIFKAQKGHINLNDKIFSHHQFRNNDDVIEEWTLSVHHFFSSDFISEPEAQVKPLMDKAWRWYRSYLDFNDSSIGYNGKR